MPYVFDQTEVEWPDDGTDPLPPQLSDFEFLPAPEFCGATEQVRFDQNGELISKPNAMVVPHNRRQSGAETENLFALLLPCLRSIGTEKIYCRADGGNDEGFSWVSHAVVKGGEHVEVDQLCVKLASSAMFTPEVRSKLVWQGETRSDTAIIQDTLEIDLCSETWGIWLLGDGFGTGEYSFYCAYIVDLVNGTIDEDPDAEPVVQNIEIASN